MSSAGVVTISPVRDENVFSSPLHSPRTDESILIYVAMSGSMVPLRVLESDSIESVKLRIQSYKGVFVKNQKLVCSGRELARSNSLVREYGVADGNVIHLVLRFSDLQVINVKTSCGKEFKFHVERSRDVGYVKRQLAKGLVDIEEQEVLCEGEQLEDQKLINDICKNNDAVIHLFVRKSAKIRPRPVEKHFELSIVTSPLSQTREYDVDRESELEFDAKNDLLSPREPTNKEFLLEPIIVNPKAELPNVLYDMMNSTLDGLEMNDPIPSSEGTGGAYFMMDASGSKYLSVFKPTDEEPMAVNNPTGLPLSIDGEGLKKGTKVEEGAFREVAAYILDHPKNGRRSFTGEDKGFAGVPPTTLIKCLHPGFNHPNGVIKAKIGSLQMFMENLGSCEDMGPGSFPIEEVHKISVLDIRMANADRHAGNILMSKGEDGRMVLIPIDHGYCLPYSFEDCTFDWLYWPQARQPFSPDTIDYIRSLDAEEDIALLNFYGWDLPLECARTLRISTMLLKKGVEKGLTPFAIGSIMCRENLNKQSVIEEIVQEAEDSVLPCSSEGAFMDSVSQIMDRHLDAIA